MNTRKTTILAGAILLLAATANAAPIQWADNGHWYDVVWVDAGLSWQDARDLASQSGGHLATLTSAEENAFVWDFLNTSLADNTRYRSYWLGGYQTDLTIEPLGNWGWVTGEEWSYAPWHPGEPNNGARGTQHYLHYWDTETGEWDDMDNRAHMGGYVLEFSGLDAAGTPHTAPEPATMMLFGLGLIGIAGFRRRILK